MPHNLYAYDAEILRNFFSITFVDIQTKSDKHVFVISPWRNDLEPLLDFLSREDLKLVGFNSLGFDYPLIHPLLVNDFSEHTGEEIVEFLRSRAELVLSENWFRDYTQPLIPQLDLFRVWHFNNKARYTSLKYLQINMDWPDVREMPYHHSHEVKQGAEEGEILDYNLNDVLSTIEFYERSKNKIKMRKILGDKYKKDFRNSPDTRIGEAIFLNVMSKLTGYSEKELASRKTERSEIHLKDAIPEGVYFASDQFGGVLKQFKEMVITNTRNIDKDKKDLFSVVFDGMKYDFGFGGLHGVRESGIYNNVDSADVGGYYPSLSIVKNIYPHHLGPAFPQAHAVIKQERAQYAKGTSESDGLKLAGNGVFGMMNAPWSPFFDPLAAMKTTIGGQLLLAQLCEWLTMANAGRIIMVNTDGFEIEVKNRERYEKMCQIWQKEHGLVLEFSRYKTLAIRDVNNYIGVKEDGKVKEKGDYVTEPELYKDQSMKIVKKAVREYFVNQIPVEKTIDESKDIKMFIMGRRAKTGNLEYRYARTLIEFVREELPKNIRYYVSHSGGAIVKVLKGKKEIPKKQKPKRKQPENQLPLFDTAPSNEFTLAEKATFLKKRKWQELKNGKWVKNEWVEFNMKYEKMGVDVDKAVRQAIKDSEEKIVNIHVGERMTLFNKWEHKPFEEYYIKKEFYINEAKKLIDPIINVQATN